MPHWSSAPPRWPCAQCPRVVGLVVLFAGCVPTSHPYPYPTPTPPATPQGGSPAPLSHYSFPYFLGFAVWVWVISSVVSVLPAGLRRSRSRDAPASLRSLGCDFAVRLVASGALIRVRATFPSVGGPTPYQLPDLDDVHSLYLLFQHHPRLTPKHDPCDCGVIWATRL